MQVAKKDQLEPCLISTPNLFKGALKPSKVSKGPPKLIETAIGAEVLGWSPRLFAERR